VKHRAARPHSHRRSIPAVVVTALLITGAAWSGAIVNHLGDHASKVSTAGRKDPAATASLNKSTYSPGEVMTLRLTDNLWAHHTWTIDDSAGRAWTKKSDDKKGATFTATAGDRSGTVTIVLTRDWDDAWTGVSVSYRVSSGGDPTTAPTTSATPTSSQPTTSTPTSTPPTSSAPATTTHTTQTTPTTSTATSSQPAPTSVPGSQWPGQIPGKFYLGMSCGTTCSSKEAQLGQGYGVHRQYKNWGDWSGVAKDIQQDSAAGRLPWISIKGPGGGPAGWQAVAEGSYDDQIRALATVLKANDAHPVLITFHHEPSNDGTEAQGALWAGAYVRFHDVLKAEGALTNVADPPILGDWLFNPTNRTQDPANWVTDAVLQRAPFMGIDLYENSSGETFADRIPRILDWMAQRGYPNKMIGIGESGSTDSSYPLSAVEWLNESLSWVAQHTDKVGVVSYFNSTNNSRSGVYWPLDETTAKLNAYKGWLNNAVTID
jgi:cell division septation protein DedD